VPAWLERAGSNVKELVELMRAAGYEGYGLGTRRRLLRHALYLVAGPSPDALPPGAFDIVWLPGDGPLATRVAELRARHT
jgi:hypothetical protein